MDYIKQNEKEDIYQCKVCKGYHAVPRGCDAPLCPLGCEEKSKTFWKNPKDTNGFAACDECVGGEMEGLNNGNMSTWQNGKKTLCKHHYNKLVMP